MILVDILIVIASYLVGSIPTAYILTKARLGKDIREIGSGNVGSTNAVRAMGFGYGLLVFIVDVAKGYLPVFAAQLIGGVWLTVFVSLATFIGHLYPMWLNFRGGKGVATGLGMSLAISPLHGLICFGLWFVVSVATGYVAIGSVIGVCSFGIICLFTAAPWPYTLVFLLIGGIVAVRHRSNFAKIMAGQEDKNFRRKHK